MLFASTSALVARFVTHPLDSIKTLTQYSSRNQNYSLPRKFASYWKGLSASLLFSVPATAVYLTCYDEAKVFFAGNNSPDSLGVHVLAAASAELSSAVFWTPMVRLFYKGCA